MKLKIVGIVILYFLCINIAFAVTFFDSAYNLKQNGNPINGNLEIRIYNSTLNNIYTESFTGAIVNGTYGVTVGLSGGLTLYYGEIYYKDYSINGVDTNFTLSNGSIVSMLQFTSNMGEVNGNAINENTLKLNNTYYDWNWLSNVPFIINQIALNNGINSSMIDINSVTNDMIVSLNWTKIINKPIGLDDGDNDYCNGGICDGNLQVNGNMTVLGTYINLTVIQRTANGSFNPELNNTFDLGNESNYWRIIYGHINWSNILNKPQGFDDNIDNDTIYFPGNYILIDASNIVSINEAQLNATIDSIAKRYNSSVDFTSLNNSKLDKSDQRYNETSLILTVNQTLWQNATAQSQEIEELWQNATGQTQEIELLKINVSNIWSTFVKFVSGSYLYMTGQTIEVNETKLNQTIDARTVLFNQTKEIDAINANITQINNSKLDKTDQRYNESSQINSVNNSLNALQNNLSANYYNKTEVNTLIASAQGSDYNSTGYIIEESDVFSLNETKLNLTITTIATEIGSQANTSSNMSFYFNQTPSVFNGSFGSYAQAQGKTGYLAGNEICNYYFSGTHFCHYFEILYTMQYKNISQLSSWSGYAWVNMGGAKYAPASVPFDDCKGWTQGDNERGGNFYLFSEGYFGAVKCGTPNEKALSCCKIW